MRTTIDLPEDLLAAARHLARDDRTTLSAAVASIMRRALDTGPPRHTVRIENGHPVIHMGKRVTSQDVASLEDE